MPPSQTDSVCWSWPTVSVLSIWNISNPWNIVLPVLTWFPDPKHLWICRSKAKMNSDNASWQAPNHPTLEQRINDIIAAITGKCSRLLHPNKQVQFEYLGGTANHRPLRDWQMWLIQRLLVTRKLQFGPDCLTQYRFRSRSMSESTVLQGCCCKTPRYKWVRPKTCRGIISPNMTRYLSFTIKIYCNSTIHESTTDSILSYCMYCSYICTYVHVRTYIPLNLLRDKFNKLATRTHAFVQPYEWTSKLTGR